MGRYARVGKRKSLKRESKDEDEEYDKEKKQAFG